MLCNSEGIIANYDSTFTLQPKNDQWSIQPSTWALQIVHLNLSGICHYGMRVRYIHVPPPKVWHVLVIHFQHTFLQMHFNTTWYRKSYTAFYLQAKFCRRQKEMFGEWWSKAAMCWGYNIAHCVSESKITRNIYATTVLKAMSTAWLNMAQKHQFYHGYNAVQGDRNLLHGKRNG